MIQRFVLESSETLYNSIKPLLFRLPAGEAHARALRLLALADR